MTYQISSMHTVPGRPALPRDWSFPLHNQTSLYALSMLFDEQACAEPCQGTFGNLGNYYDE